MNQFESKVVAIPYSQQRVYDMLSDLSHLESVKDRIPEDKVKELAADLGITRVRVVANKVRDAQDEEYIKARIPEEDLLGFIHYNAEVIDADRAGQSPYDCSASAVEEIRAIKAKIDAEK